MNTQQIVLQLGEGTILEGPHWTEPVKVLTAKARGSRIARRLLALRNIDQDKATKRQLTEEQLKDLAGGLKEAEARLPAALATVYRFVLVPAKNKTLRTFDLGISGYSGKTTLSNLVAEKLITEQQILEKLDSAILIWERFGLWPADQEVVNVKTLADYFTQLTHLPRLSNPDVLPGCLSKGVHQGLFAHALGDGEKKEFDTIHFNDKSVGAADCEITDTAWLMRPALAKTLIPEKEPEKVVTGGGTGTATPPEQDGDTGTGDDWGKPGKIIIKEGERRLNKVRIDIKNCRGRTGTTFTTRSSNPSPTRGPKSTARSSSSPRATVRSGSTRSS